jgi:hypothetical protein
MMETIFVSRQEIDDLAHALSLKGRSLDAVVHLERNEDNVLHYRHAQGEIWWPIITAREVHPSGASNPR